MNLDFKSVLTVSIDHIKNNPLIFAPQVLWGLVYFLMIFVLLGGALLGAGALGGSDGGTLALGFFGALMIFSIVMLLVSIFTFGWTSGMAADVVETGQTSLGGGLSRFMSLLGPVVLVMIILGICSMFALCLIGIVGLFLFMFALPAVISGGFGAIDSLKESFELVKENIVDSIVLVAIAAGLSVIVYIISFIISLVLSIIPVIGSIVGGVISGLLSAAVGTFVIVLVFEVYRELAGGTEMAAEVPQPMA